MLLAIIGRGSVRLSYRLSKVIALVELVVVVVLILSIAKALFGLTISSSRFSLKSTAYACVHAIVCLTEDSQEEEGW
jgi:hypothetical protein